MRISLAEDTGGAKSFTERVGRRRLVWEEEPLVEDFLDGETGEVRVRKKRVGVAISPLAIHYDTSPWAEALAQADWSYAGDRAGIERAQEEIRRHLQNLESSLKDAYKGKVQETLRAVTPLLDTPWELTRDAFRELLSLPPHEGPPFARTLLERTVSFWGRQDYRRIADFIARKHGLVDGWRIVQNLLRMGPVERRRWLLRENYYTTDISPKVVHETEDVEREISQWRLKATSRVVGRREGVLLGTPSRVDFMPVHMEGLTPEEASEGRKEIGDKLRALREDMQKVKEDVEEALEAMVRGNRVASEGALRRAMEKAGGFVRIQLERALDEIEGGEDVLKAIYGALGDIERRERTLVRSLEDMRKASIPPSKPIPWTSEQVPSFIRIPSPSPSLYAEWLFHKHHTESISEGPFTPLPREALEWFLDRYRMRAGSSPQPS